MVFPSFLFIALYSSVFCSGSYPEEYVGYEIDRGEVKVKVHEQMAFLTKETIDDLFNRLLTKEQLKKINFVTNYKVKTETIEGKTGLSITFESDFLDTLNRFDMEFRKFLQDGQSSYIVTTHGHTYNSQEHAIAAFNLKIQTKIGLIFNKIKNVIK